MKKQKEDAVDFLYLSFYYILASKKIFKSLKKPYSTGELSVVLFNFRHGLELFLKYIKFRPGHYLKKSFNLATEIKLRYEDIEYLSQRLNIREQEIKSFFEKILKSELISLISKFIDRSYLFNGPFPDAKNTNFRYPNEKINKKLTSITEKQIEILGSDLNFLFLIISTMLLYFTRDKNGVRTIDSIPEA